MIAGLGTDVVECARIGRMLEKHGDAFRTRVYSRAELEQVKERRDSLAFYAGRWAVKEAAAKALGCGIGRHCAFTEVEVENNPETGAPVLKLSGEAAKYVEARGGGKFHVSLSHEEAYAVGTVIWEQ